MRERPPQLSLIVLRTAQITETRDFYEAVGLRFTPERHGKGPLHYAAQLGTLVVEIYPLPPALKGTADTTMLGFALPSFDTAVAALEALGISPRSPSVNTPRGRRVVFTDPDGRSVELLEPPTETDS